MDVANPEDFFKADVSLPKVESGDPTAAEPGDSVDTADAHWDSATQPFDSRNLSKSLAVEDEINVEPSFPRDPRRPLTLEEEAELERLEEEMKREHRDQRNL